MKNFFFLMLVLLGTTVSQAQDINSYKYIIVPQEFDFLKEPDQYQLNSLTKFLFEKNGFETYFEGEKLPEDLSKNPCEALNAEVENNSGLFKTRVNVILKDCYNKQVFVSEEGRSREKDYKDAYHEALRNAFESIEELNYSYNETIVSARPEMPEKPKTSGIQEENMESGRAQNPVTVNPVEDNVQKRITSDSEMIFTRDNSGYILRKTEKGYNLYQEGTEEPFAALVKSTSGNYIYSAINSQGMAHFDKDGNLVVEVLNSETGAIDSVVYKIQP